MLSENDRRTQLFNTTADPLTGDGHHDDLLMTRAIGLWVCYREMPRPYFVKTAGMKYTATATV